MSPVALLALAAALAAPPKLESYASEAGRFSIRFPGKPKVESTTLATAAGGVSTVTERAEQNRDLTFAVTYADYPDTFQDLDPKAILKGVRDAMKGKDGKLISEEFPSGSEAVFRIEAGRNAIRVRAILVGRRLYQVMATGTKAEVDSKTADEVLGSFELKK